MLTTVCLFSASIGAAKSPPGNCPPLFRLVGHTSGVTRIAFSPDGRYLATASSDHTVRVWESAVGREVVVLRKLRARFACVAFSPDGRTLAAGSDDQSVRLWDVRSWQLQEILDEHRGDIVDLAFADAGKSLITVCDDGEVRLWDRVSRRQRLVWQAGGKVTAFSLFPDQKAMALALYEGIVKVWTLASNQEKVLMLGHRSRIWTLAYAPDGHMAASGGGQLRDLLTTGAEELFLWEPHTGHHVGSLRGLRDPVWCLAFSLDSKMLVSGEGHRTGGAVRLWDTATGALLACVTLEQPVTAVAFSPDGRMLAAAGTQISVWRTSSLLLTSATSR